MHLPRRIWIQLAALAVISTVAIGFMVFGYMKVPSTLLGVGRYEVTLELPQTGGLYPRGNVTYRGTEVGVVDDVRLTRTGVAATLRLDSRYQVPSNLEAEVHSQTAVGELYVALLPRDGTSPPLKDGDVITRDNTRVPPSIDTLLDATNRGLQAIPRDNLRTAIDESYLAFGGLGPEITRFVKGSTQLAIDADHDLGPMTTLIDQAAPVLDTQADTADSIHAWAEHLAVVTRQLKDNDADVRGILHDAPAAAEAARALFDRLHVTLPVVMANLASVAPVLVTYRDSLEQALVLLPQGAATMQAILVPNANTKQAYKGAYLSFNLNVNLPPPCTTGFLPAQQQRVPALTDYPDPPAGDIYCRVPQNSPFNVRGARNLPCVTRPGKRAPTVKMCESDQNYVPLNDGYNWKGDPNATLSGQDVPQIRDAAAAPPPAGASAPDPAAAGASPIAVAEYDPATGSYVGPDGKVYTQGDLAANAPLTPTLQTMLLPPSAP